MTEEAEEVFYCVCHDEDLVGNSFPAKCSDCGKSVWISRATLADLNGKGFIAKCLDCTTIAVQKLKDQNEEVQFKVGPKTLASIAKALKKEK